MRVSECVSEGGKEGGGSTQKEADECSKTSLEAKVYKQQLQLACTSFDPVSSPGRKDYCNQFVKFHRANEALLPNSSHSADGSLHS